MREAIGKKDVLWSYIGQITNYGVHILLTPIISVKLSSYELGLWYTFTSIFTLVNFFDSGFSPLIMRNAAYCMGGARTLLKEGIQNNQNGREEACNYGLLKTLYRTARKLYSIMAMVLFFLLLMFGLPYIRYITRTDFQISYLIAFVIYVCGIAVNIFMIFLPAYLKGLGSIAQIQKIYAIGRGTQLVLSITGVFAGFGIMALSGSFLIGNLIICVGAYVHYVKKWRKKIQAAAEQMTQRSILEVLWFNAKKLGLVSLGRYMATQGNILICSTFLTLEMSARYGLTVQVLQAVGSVSMIYLQAVVPTISTAKVERNIQKEKKYFSMAIVIYWGMYICAAAAVYWLANPILNFLGGNTKLLEGAPLVLAIFTFFLQYNQMSFSLYIGMGNRVPYVNGEFFSGIFTMAAALLAVRCINTGVMGVLLAQCIVQACYNDWKWPYEVCRELHMSLRDILYLGIVGVKKEIESIMVD